MQNEMIQRREKMEEIAKKKTLKEEIGYRSERMVREKERTRG